MPAKIVHLALKVNDIEESLRFYEQIFGFSHTNTHRAGPLKDHLSCWLSDGSLGFTLIQYDSEDAPESKAVGKGPCIQHFGIEVPAEELQGYIGKIKAAGCEIISPPGVLPMKFRGPGGGAILEVGTPADFPR